MFLFQPSSRPHFMRRLSRRRRPSQTAVPAEILEQRRLLSATASSTPSDPGSVRDQLNENVLAEFNVRILVNGVQAEHVDVGQEFQIEVTVRDRRVFDVPDPNFRNVALATFDLVYDADLISPALRTGEADPSGLLNDVSQFNLFTPGPELQVLNRTFTAGEDGRVEIRVTHATPGEEGNRNGIILNERPGSRANFEVLEDETFYGSASLTIGAGEPAPAPNPSGDVPEVAAVRVVLQPTAGGARSTETLPDSAQTIDEWNESVFIEVYGNVPDGSDASLQAYSFDLTFDSDLFDSTDDIEIGESFDGDVEGSVTRADGRITVRAGSVAESGVTRGGQVLLARIRFTLRDGLDLIDNETGRYKPAAARFDVKNLCYTSTDGVESAGRANAAETTVWPVIYDIDRDGVVSFGDVTAFARQFGRVATTPEARLVDFDLNGSISFGDVSAFARHFGASRGSTALRTYPTGNIEPAASSGIQPVATEPQTPDESAPVTSVTAVQSLSQAAASSTASELIRTETIPAREPVAVIDVAPTQTASGHETPLDVEELTAGQTDVNATDSESIDLFFTGLTETSLIEL